MKCGENGSSNELKNWPARIAALLVRSSYDCLRRQFLETLIPHVRPNVFSSFAFCVAVISATLWRTTVPPVGCSCGTPSARPSALAAAVDMASVAPTVDKEMAAAFSAGQE
jgi:hypothetical protein